MTDLDHYDYYSTTKTDWLSVIIITAIPVVALFMPMVFIATSLWDGEITDEYNIKIAYTMVFLYFSSIFITSILGWILARGCPMYVKTVEQVEKLPTFGQKKKVLK